MKFILCIQKVVCILIILFAPLSYNFVTTHKYNTHINYCRYYCPHQARIYILAHSHCTDIYDHVPLHAPAHTCHAKKLVPGGWKLQDKLRMVPLAKGPLRIQAEVMKGMDTTLHR